jgi:hypothetical protein
MSNTRTIDNYLLSFWVLNKLNTNFIEKLPQLGQANQKKIIISNIEKKSGMKQETFGIQETIGVPK